MCAVMAFYGKANCEYLDVNQADITLSQELFNKLQNKHVSGIIPKQSFVNISLLAIEGPHP